MYRARDTRLGRDVAIKTLPDSFLADPDRVARLERESRVLAALNHPHVGAIYGLKEARPPGGNNPAMPMFIADGRHVSVAAREGRGRDAIWILDAKTGEPLRTAVRFPGSFTAEFRANWADNGRASIVTRAEDISHVVMFDQFWVDRQ